MPITLKNQRLLKKDSRDDFKHAMDQSSGHEHTSEEDKKSKVSIGVLTYNQGRKPKVEETKDYNKKPTVPLNESYVNGSLSQSDKSKGATPKSGVPTKQKEGPKEDNILIVDNSVRSTNIVSDKPQPENLLVKIKDDSSSGSRNKAAEVDEQAKTMKPQNDFDPKSADPKPINQRDTEPLPKHLHEEGELDQLPSKGTQKETTRDEGVQKEDTKDEGIQINPLPAEVIQNTTKKDFGVQFTFEDSIGSQDEEVKLAKLFDDEQGTGHYKPYSESEDKQKDSEATTENYKASFDSRRTSNNKLSNFGTDDPKTPARRGKDMHSENTETRDDHKNVLDTPKTEKSPLNTDRTLKKYHDIDNLALFTLKDWKDSKIYDWYSTATKAQRVRFIEYVIRRENEESGSRIEVLNEEELTYVLNLINSREYTTKRTVKEEQREDGTISSAFVKFDVFNVLELFEALKRTIVFVYGLFGLDKYIVQRVYGIYHQEDDKLFRTTENATKLCIRCKLGYEMIEKWTHLIDLIVERNLISQSVWNIIHEVTNK